LSRSLKTLPELTARVVATADNPVYTYDSYVDNTTNDATFNRGH